MAPAEGERPNAKNMPAATDCTSRCRGRSSLLSRCTAAAQTQIVGGHGRGTRGARASELAAAGGHRLASRAIALRSALAAAVRTCGHVQQWFGAVSEALQSK